MVKFLAHFLLEIFSYQHINTQGFTIPLGMFLRCSTVKTSDSDSTRGLTAGGSSVVELSSSATVLLLLADGSMLESLLGWQISDEFWNNFSHLMSMKSSHEVQGDATKHRDHLYLKYDVSQDHNYFQWILWPVKDSLEQASDYLL